MSDEKIKCEGLVKTYNHGKPNEFKALKGVDLVIKKGDFVSITGHSGSGKSTFLNQISCLDTPTEGKVYIEGADIGKLSDFEKAKLRREKLGFVFQQFNLVKSMSAFENIELPMEFGGTPEGRRKERVRKLLELVDITEKAGNLPAEMSGGQQQRVAIARALANDPDIILADEPTGNLDSKTGDMIMKLLMKLNREEGKTLVMVTHETSIAKMADRMIVLKDGQISSDSKRKWIKR
ncbi:MAG: ABC transporter ATP-binding protein [Candidatus Altiarchaeota archaeon]|nr:ABC transporter ATP-binding protein [Candidatus Altiarchaeota archaeon]